MGGGFFILAIFLEFPINGRIFVKYAILTGLSALETADLGSFCPVLSNVPDFGTIWRGPKTPCRQEPAGHYVHSDALLELISQSEK